MDLCLLKNFDCVPMLILFLGCTNNCTVLLVFTNHLLPSGPPSPPLTATTPPSTPPSFGARCRPSPLSSPRARAPPTSGRAPPTSPLVTGPPSGPPSPPARGRTQCTSTGSPAVRRGPRPPGPPRSPAPPPTARGTTRAETPSVQTPPSPATRLKGDLPPPAWCLSNHWSPAPLPPSPTPSLPSTVTAMRRAATACPTPSRATTGTPPSTRRCCRPR